MEGRSYAIIGSGALGAYYGALLARVGAPVHFLLHSDYRHVKEKGLRVFSEKLGDISPVSPSVYGAARDMPRCDVAIVAIKTTANDALRDILPHVIKPDGVALVMQNGLGIEDDVAKIVGPERVMGGLSFLCCNKIGPGDVLHLDYGQVRLGEYSAEGIPRGITPRMMAITADLRRAGVHVDLEDDLLLARWKKLVWNVPYNGLAVLLDAQTDALMAHPQARQLCIDLMREVVTGAKSVGRDVPESHVRAMIDHTDKMVPYRPSMKLDYDARRPMEVEAIYGNPLRAAAAAGCDMPKMRMLYDALKFLNERNRP